jgi:hypothetical protein
MALIINGIERIETTHVPQVAVATLSLTGGTVADVFTIAGSPIEVLGLFTHVTTAVSANACTFKWQLDPTSGASSTDLCTAVDIQGLAIGDVYYILGTSASALQIAANGTAVALSCTARAFLLPGGIDAVLQNSDPTSGFATVYLIYRRMTLTGTVT